MPQQRYNHKRVFYVAYGKETYIRAKYTMRKSARWNRIEIWLFKISLYAAFAADSKTPMKWKCNTFSLSHISAFWSIAIDKSNKKCTYYLKQTDSWCPRRKCYVNCVGGILEVSVTTCITYVAGWKRYDNENLHECPEYYIIRSISTRKTVRLSSFPITRLYILGSERKRKENYILIHQHCCLSLLCKIPFCLKQLLLQIVLSL